jgi:hypothetical protein
MIARALGFRGSGNLPAARNEIDNAYSTLLGPQSHLLRMLDPVSAARLIGSAKKLAALARLTAAESALAGDMGNLNSEQLLAARAVLLAEEAVKLDPSDDDVVAALREMRPT